jgi:hypothetical protein
LLADDGDGVSGKFLIRSKGASTDNFIFSVMFQGKPSHHAVARSGSGEDFTVNKAPTGADSLADVVEFLRVKTKLWPVSLTQGIVGSGNGSAGDASSSNVGAPPSLPLQSKPLGGSGGGELTEWFHGPIKKAQADVLLLADDGDGVSGKFLIRSKGASTDNFIFSVIFQGKPSHHAVVRSASGEDFTVNKAPTGVDSLADVVEFLRVKTKLWPVSLTSGVASESVASVPAQLPETSTKNQQGLSSEKTRWFHGPIKKSEAEKLLIAEGGDGVEGKFLIRSKKDSENDYIFSVVFQGKPSHHAVARSGRSEEFTVNKAPTGADSLADVVEFLRVKTKRWPVSLTEGVEGVAVVSTTSAPDDSRKRKQKTVPTFSSELTQWFHGSIAKSQAEKLLLANSGDEVEGKYLIRSKKDSTDNFIFSVVFQGNPSHHAVARSGPGGEFMVNKAPTGVDSLTDVVDFLRVKTKRWPVSLTEGVTNGEDLEVSDLAEPEPETELAHAASTLPPTATAAPIETAEFVGNSDNINVPVLPPRPSLMKNSVASKSSGPEGKIKAAEASVVAAQEAHDAAVTNLERIRSGGSGPMPEADPMRPHYLWGDICREDSEAMLAGEADGSFLLRTRDGQHQYILVMIFRGKPSHHLLAQGDDGTFLVNKKAMGGKTTIEGCVNHMRRPLDIWPIALKKGIANPDVAAPKKAGGSVMQAMQTIRAASAKLEVAKSEHQRTLLQQRAVAGFAMLGGFAGRGANTKEALREKTEDELKQQLLSKQASLNQELRAALVLLEKNRSTQEAMLAHVSPAQQRLATLASYSTVSESVDIGGQMMAVADRQVQASQLQSELRVAARSIEHVVSAARQMEKDVARIQEELKRVIHLTSRADAFGIGASPTTYIPTKQNESQVYIGAGGESYSDNLTLQERVRDVRAAWGNQTQINIVRRSITEAEEAALVLEIKSPTTAITSIRLVRNNLREATVRAMFTALAKNKVLTHLSIRKNDIGDDVLQALVGPLATNTTLRYISFNSNAIGDRGSKLIADVLRRNRTLIDVSLRDNNISGMGADILADALKMNTVINKVALYHNPEFTRGQSMQVAVSGYSNCLFLVAPVYV